MLDERIDRVESKIGGVEGKIDRIEKILVALEPKITELFHTAARKPDLEALRVEVTGLGGRLDTSDVRLQGAEEKLQTRIDSFEDRLRVRIDNVDERLGIQIKGVGETLGARIKSVEDRIALVPTTWQTIAILGTLLIGISGIIFTAGKFFAP